MTAARSGNVAAVKALIAKGANVNALSQDGRSPLFEAVLDPTKVDNVKLLLAANADLSRFIL